MKLILTKEEAIQIINSHLEVRFDPKNYPLEIEIKTEEKEMLKKLAWFVLEYMNDRVSFSTAFGIYFTPEEVGMLDNLTDKLFMKEEKIVSIEEIARTHITLLKRNIAELKESAERNPEQKEGIEKIIAFMQSQIDQLTEDLNLEK